MKKLVFISLFIILSLNTLDAFAGKPGIDNKRFGVFGGANFNYHKAEISQLSDNPNCCYPYPFTKGNSIGAAAGILFEIPITKSLKYGVRLGYYDLGAEFTEEEYSYYVGPNGHEGNSIIEHSLVGSITVAGLENTAMYRLSKDLFLSAGLRIDYVLSSKFAQVSTLIEPNSAVFPETNKRTKNEFSGNNPNANSIFVSGVFGISYDFKLNQRISIVPEITYSFSFTDVAKDIDWRANAILISMAVKWSM